MDSYEIYENCDQYTAFPEVDDVFASDFEKECMLPLGIMHVDIDDAVHNVLLAVPTISDEGGFIGRDNIGEYCGELWLTYSKRNGRWSLDCEPLDFRSLDQAPDEVRVIYEESKSLFKEHGFIPSPYLDKLPLLKIGGEITSYGNVYAYTRKFIPNVLRDRVGEPPARKLVTFIGGDGGEYVHLGRANGGVYSACAGDFEFFFNPSKDRVLTIIEYD